MEGAAKLDELRGRLAGLSRLLGSADDSSGDAPGSPPGSGGGGSGFTLHVLHSTSNRAVSPLKPALKQQQPGRKSAAPRPSAAPRSPPFKSVIAPSKSVLRATNVAQPSGGGPAYASFKEEEAKLLAQKGELQLLLSKEKKRRIQLEAELKRAQEMHTYRVGEVKHLKAALKQRDDHVLELQDRVRELELCNTADKVAREAVQQAEAERDELRGAMQEMLQRLAHTNEIMEHTDQTIAGMEAKVQSMDLERQSAMQQAAAAAAHVASLQETVASLEWKCGMLQQLADMTLQQNEEKMAALRQLLQSESALDDSGDGDSEGEAAAAAAAAAAFSELGFAETATDGSTLGSP